LRPAVTTPLLLALLTLPAAGGCRPGAPDPPPLRPLVLVTIDTLRADHLGAYGYPRETTPFLDRLAEGGVLFENAVSASSHTAPSHASIMTSLQPFQHGLLENGHPLPPGHHTLADLLAASGYQTAAFTSVGFLVELGQGFDHFDAAWRTGDRTTDAALAWLDARGAGAPPFFLWLHLYDPHKLKGPRETLQADAERLRLEAPEARRRFLDYLEARGLPQGFYPDEEALLERFDLYDAGIRFADRQVARLYQRVQEIAPDARWVVTSDHGEGMGNHEYDEHGRYLYDEQIRVPLIVAGVDGPPRRVRRMVRLVDLYPTVADWLGRPAPTPGEAPGLAPVQGYPLLSEPGETGALSPRLAFAERRPKDRAAHRRRWEEGEVYSLRGREFKYVYHSQGPDELYDLAADPMELHNLVGEAPDRAAALRAALLAYLEGTAVGGAPRTADEDAFREHEKELRALGYID
jgi:arylsulfatase A-like enzyme